MGQHSGSQATRTRLWNGDTLDVTVISTFCVHGALKYEEIHIISLCSMKLQLVYKIRPFISFQTPCSFVCMRNWHQQNMARVDWAFWHGCIPLLIYANYEVGFTGWRGQTE